MPIPELKSSEQGTSSVQGKEKNILKSPIFWLITAFLLSLLVVLLYLLVFIPMKESQNDSTSNMNTTLTNNRPRLLSITTPSNLRI